MRHYDLWQREREAAEVVAGGLKVLRDVSQKSGRCHVLIFRAKAEKPFANYVFPDEARREAFIAQQIETELDRQRRVAQRKEQRAGRLDGVKLEPVEVGDIFNWSWGYDQTNQDFYQVVERRGRRVVVRSISQSIVPGSEGFMSESVLGVKDSFLEKTYRPGNREGETLIKLVQYTNEGKAYLAMEFGWCDLWDGKPQYASHYA